MELNKKVKQVLEKIEKQSNIIINDTYTNNYLFYAIFILIASVAIVDFAKHGINSEIDLAMYFFAYIGTLIGYVANETRILRNIIKKLLIKMENAEKMSNENRIYKTRRKLSGHTWQIQR